VESVLFRARRRLEREYEELDTGRRCDAMRSAIARLAEQAGTAADERRLARHTRRCTSCRRRARQLGVDPKTRTRSIAARAAALLPLPAFLRRRAAGVSQPGSGSAHNAPPLVDVLGPGTTQFGFALSERAAALVAAAALAGAGGAMLAGGPASIDRGASSASPAAKEQRPAPSPRRESGGARFERPKSTQGGARRDAAPRFRPAAPRSGSAAPAAPQRSQPAPNAPAKPASASGLDGLPDDLGLGNDGNGQGSPVDLSVDPGGAITGSLPSGTNSPPSGPAPAPPSPPPLATVAVEKPPAVTHGTGSGHHSTESRRSS
jgi:hypothetical protein